MVCACWMAFLIVLMLYKIAAWNVRGLNDPIKHREFKKIISDENIKGCDLIETRVKSCNMANICKKNFSLTRFLIITMNTLLMVEYDFVGTLLV